MWSRRTRTRILLEKKPGKKSLKLFLSSSSFASPLALLMHSAAAGIEESQVGPQGGERGFFSSSPWTEEEQ